MPKVGTLLSALVDKRAFYYKSLPKEGTYSGLSLYCLLTKLKRNAKIEAVQKAEKRPLQLK